MSLVVSYLRPVTAGGGATAAGRVRKKEVISVPATTTITAEEGEFAHVFNTETAVTLVAYGSTPDAQAATATSATSAGITVAAGLDGPLLGPLATGDKVNAKTVA
jgi:acyl-coenzyme A thioesterase PaaI-like protein